MRTLYWCYLTLLLGLVAQTAFASHTRGGDIAYAPVASTTAGVPRYHVTLRLFSDNGPAVAPSPATAQMRVIPGGCGGGIGTPLSLPRTQLANGAPLACASPSPLYLVGLYEADVDLPAGQWLLTYSEAARPAVLQNVTNPTSQAMFLSAYLDNSLAPQNSSPRFETALQPVVASSTIPPASLSAFDVNGDSLRYELLMPQTACNQAVAGTPAPHFQLNAATGALTATALASSSGGYAIMVKVSEYRRINGQWQLIGYVMRDTMYLLATGANRPPAFTTVQVNSGPTQPLGQLIRATPGQPLRLTLAAADPDAGQQLRFATELGSVVPGLSVATPNGQLQLSWDVPATLPPGLYALAVGVLDDGCAYNASEERTLLVRLTNQTLGTRTAAASALPAAWPTPFREQVQFAAPAGQPVLVVDARGRPVAQLLAGPDGLVRWLPAPGLAPGLYLARSPAGAPLARLLRAE